MKRSHPAVKTALVFFIAGILFFSCTAAGNNEYGTLVLTLPGDGARAAVSSAFTATLKYDIRCTGPGWETRQASSGGPVSIPLLAGNWTVTVSVLNAADEEIGRETAAALVERGKAVRVDVPVRIDTSRNDITEFTLITKAEAAAGSIDQEEKSIAVFVAPGTSLTNLDFTLVHTGAALSPAPGTPLSFTSPQPFTVTAENGTQKTYTVTVDASEEWPDTSVWADYGLPGLQAPSGAIITSVDNNGTKLEVKLLTVNLFSDAFEELIEDIERITGTSGSTGGIPGLTAEYTLNYTGHSLSLTNNQFVLTLSVTKN
jgi:hypothetical protein